MAKETAKKKLIRIEPVVGLYSSGVYNPALNSQMSFAFAGPNERVEDGIKYREQVTKFYTCREQLCGIPRHLLHERLDKYVTVNRVDMTRLRLLVACGDYTPGTGSGSLKDRIFSGKRVLNVLEEEAGWDKSIITTVKHTYFKDAPNIYLLTGPEQWMRVPQMVSLAVLLMRISYRMGSFDFETVADVQKTFKAIIKDESFVSNDRTYLSETRKHMVTLMKNIDKVFKGGSKPYYVDPEKGGAGWLGYGGISSLCKCATGNEDLHKRMRKYVFDAKKK